MDVLSHRSRNLLGRVACIVALCATANALQTATAAPAKASKKQEPAQDTQAIVERVDWIWSPAHEKDQVPAATCYFRRMLELSSVNRAEIQITCDDQYELYVNGKKVGAGQDWKLFQVHDVSKFLKAGLNVVAVKATNVEVGSAGMVASIFVERRDGEPVIYPSDTSWKCSLKSGPGWEQLSFDDSRWVAARSFGEFGTTAPWEGKVVSVNVHGAGRFKINPEFRIEQVVPPAETGSLIAMTFNEWGEVLASRENGPILLIIDDDEDGIPETVTTWCTEVRNCQGLLALNGQVFAVGDGPQGAALYRLEDKDEDERAETVTALIEFDGEMGEHGAHAVTLGPDGLIYVLVGNHTSPKPALDKASPHHDFYEGDLVLPRYEDAGGHGVGVKAPGGTVLRTNVEGSFVQMVAGGLRNPYDLVFNERGDLFTFDSDMEWDEGLPWYRPTRLLHVVSGGEYGWRAGWSKWPDYYIDSLPATLDVGRGSPTGMEVYNHFMFPVRYHHALFACDWSQGRIIAFKLKPSGAGYQASAESFLEGRPLNATDLAVGPDGWLYFTTGGRGSEGGLYRVVWTGRVPPQPRQKGILRALRQPQLSSAWSRQQLAVLQEQMGADWGKQLTAAMTGSAVSLQDRLRALEISQLFGPFPATSTLIKLSFDAQPEIRAKAAWLLGIHGDETAAQRLAMLLDDTSGAVRRQACEALVRGGFSAPAEALVQLLASSDRQLNWAARRALQQLPLDEWRNQVLEAEDLHTFLSGSAALLALEVDDEAPRAVLERVGKLLNMPVDNVSDDDFVSLLRVVQLALIRGDLHGEDLPDLREQIADEYPASDPRMNRELVRLIVYLQATSALSRMLNELDGEAPLPERIHLAAHLRFMEQGWSSSQKMAVLEFLEKSRDLPGGYSYALFIDNFARDFVGLLDERERQQVIAQGTRLPACALHVLAALPKDPGNKLLSELIALDEELVTTKSPAAQRLQTGLTAVLGRSEAASAMSYLRDAFEKQPERRAEISMGLAQAPGGENWALLVRALPVLDGVAAQEVLNQLATADETPDKPEPLRQAILCGLRLGENGAGQAIALLEKWTGQKLGEDGADWNAILAAWQTWFQETYPEEPTPTLPVDPENTAWKYQELLGFLADEGAHGDSTRGAMTFEKARCVKCHRFGRRGEGVGPDLSTVSQRFQKREILESIVFPSHVVSDQYASQTVVTSDGLTYQGIVAPAGEGAVVILQASGEKVTLNKDEIESTQPTKKSAMPDGLLNTLTLEEIADLFAYLNGANTQVGRRPSKASRN